jgi:hypothetical protein
MTIASNQPPQEPATYWIGTMVSNRAEFVSGYDEFGSPIYIDPTAVYFKYTPYGQSEVVKRYGSDIEVIRVSAGIYTIELNTTGGPVGRWKTRWVSTGAGPGAVERYFEVRRSMQASP